MSAKGSAVSVRRIDVGAACPKKAASPAGRGREMILRVQQGLAAEGFEVSVSKLCRWFSLPRPTVYYRPGKSASKVDPKYVEPIKAMIEESPSFEYRTVA